MARRCKFYTRVAAFTREILFSSREENSLFFSQKVIFFLLYGDQAYLTEKAGIMTSLNDATLARVTFEKYATRISDEVAYRIFEWFSSQLDTLLHIVKLLITLVEF